MDRKLLAKLIDFYYSFNKAIIRLEEENVNVDNLYLQLENVNDWMADYIGIPKDETKEFFELAIFGTTIEDIIVDYNLNEDELIGYELREHLTDLMIDYTNYEVTKPYLVNKFATWHKILKEGVNSIESIYEFERRELEKDLEFFSQKEKVK